MKKLLILIIAILTTVVVSAQNYPTLKADQYSFTYTGTASDTVTTNDTAWTSEFVVNKATPLYYNFACKVLKVSAGACSISIQGKIFPTEDYTNITTYSFAGTQTDTTVIFTQNTTRQFYRIYRIKVLYVSGKTKVSSVIGYFKY